MRIARHGDEGVPAGLPARWQRSQGEEKAREPRTGQIDEIIEPCGRPAESEIAWRFVADHGIGGVDRLVEDDAGQAQKREPEGGRHDAVGRILSQAFERGARNARPVERLRIAPDNAAHRLASRIERCIESLGHRPHMVAQGFLGEQGRGDERFHDPAVSPLSQQQGQSKGRPAGHHQEDDEGNDAGAALAGAVFGIEPLIKPGDKLADPFDRMADRSRTFRPTAAPTSWRHAA